MSNKSARKVKLPPPPPRTMDTLQMENNQLVSRAGGLQYQILVYQEELRRVNEDLFKLNQEAAARQELDKASTSPSAPGEQLPLTVEAANG